MEIVIKPKSTYRFIQLDELMQFRDLFYILTWRDIKVRYKQTVLGVLWVILQPLVTMFVFTIFFGNFAKIPSGDLPYSLFVLLGLVYWGYFSQALNRTSGSLIENQQLIKKIYFPREIIPLSSVITSFVDFLVSFCLLILVLIAYQQSINLLFVFIVLCATVVVTLVSSGLGMFLAALNVTYRDVRYILPFFLQMLIFVTPVIYPLEIVRPAFRIILSLNPLAGYIEALRSSLSYGSISDPYVLLTSTIAAVAIFIIGNGYFKYAERKFADIL